MENNPTVKLTLVFQDGSAISFRLGHPIPQRQIMAWVGQLLGKTDNPLDIELAPEEETTKKEEVKL